MPDRQHALHPAQNSAVVDPRGERGVQRQDEEEVALLDPRSEVDREIVDHPAVLEHLVADPHVFEERRDVHGREHGVLEVVDLPGVEPAVGGLERASPAGRVVDVHQVRPVRREFEVAALDVRPRDVDPQRVRVAQHGLSGSSETRPASQKQAFHAPTEVAATIRTLPSA